MKWLMMFSAADYRKKKADDELLSELEEWAMDREQIREALIEWEALSANKENRVIYEVRAKELRDLFSNIEGERRAEKWEIALRMLEDGLEPELIAKYTDLSKEEIRKLCNQN